MLEFIKSPFGITLFIVSLIAAIVYGIMMYKGMLRLHRKICDETGETKKIQKDYQAAVAKGDMHEAKKIYKTMRALKIPILSK